MIVGIVLGPCGLVLNLTSTFAPNWRDVSHLPTESYALVQHQGIWDICNEDQSTSQTTCDIPDTLGYFSQRPVQVAKALMPSSLAVTALGLLVTSLGVRCWQDKPYAPVAGLGGLVLFISGLLSLIPVSWYTHELYNLPVPERSILKAGYSLVLGYLGSCLEIIGGLALTFSFVLCYKEHKLKKAASANYGYPSSLRQGSLSTIAAISPSVLSKEFHVHYQNSLPTSYYNNSLDGLEDKRSSRSHRSQLPCDSDL